MRANPTALAQCLLAIGHDEDDGIDETAGAEMLAEVLILIRNTLTKGPGG